MSDHKIIFVNGKSKCGCIMEFSSGGGEYSDVHTVTLCPTHSPAKNSAELDAEGQNMREILDMCCGSRMFWLNKSDPRAVFCDIRAEQHTLCDGRALHIAPDVIADFRQLPFANESFAQVVFDPPHLERAGENGWMRKKYGALNRETWRDDLRAGFAEAFRVLRPHGTLIFKWNETQIPASQVIALTDQQPTVWQRTGKGDKTHWILFLKEGPANA